MADLRILYTENMVGANHPTLDDTLNRLTLVEHNVDGTHQIKDSTWADNDPELTANSDEKIATQQAVKGYAAPINSPTFTGTPQAPTPPSSDDSPKIATTAYVKQVAMNAAVPVTSPEDIGRVLIVNQAGDAVWGSNINIPLYQSQGGI